MTVIFIFNSINIVVIFVIKNKNTIKLSKYHGEINKL